ncbi:MAG: VOC family protein [Candidatus Uhrbacteria bacterium]|nr:VOC family protein [Candidatus Uhrbacteria bacterium]
MKIHHIALTVNNLEESIEFYQNFFGFDRTQEFGREDMGARAVFLELDGMRLELWQFDSMKQNADELGDIYIRGIRHIAFEVDDIEERILFLQAHGLNPTKVKLGSSGHFYTFITDPNGIALELYQR